MIRTALAFLLMTSAVFAQSTPFAHTLPPLQYRNLPPGPVRLVRLPSLDESWRECMRRGVGNGSTACSFFYAAVDLPNARIGAIRRDSLCVIVYSDSGDLPHELGHCRVLKAGGPNGHAGWF